MLRHERNTNIDILRALCAVMVIILHFNNPGMGGAMKNITFDMRGHWLLVQGLEALCVPAVNCFIMISGFFLCRTNERQFRKVAYLFGITIGYNLLLYALCLLTGLDSNSVNLFFVRILPTNYYVALYSVLYLISPLINLAFQQLDSKKFKSTLLMLFILFGIWPTTVDFLCDLFHWWPMGVSPVAMQGNEQGYTITNFCLCYAIGMYIYQCFSQKQGRPWYQYCIMYISMSALLVLESLFTSTTFYYTNVFVIVSAAALFQMFLYHPSIGRQGAMAGKVFAFLGKHSLDVFLIHTNPLLLVYFWGTFSISTRFAQMPLLKAIIFCFTVIGCMYAVCIVTMLVFHFIILKLFSLWFRS